MFASPSFTSLSVVNVTDVIYLGKHEVWDFEVPETGNYYCAGVLNHNSGKTVCVSMEFVSRLLGRQITLTGGKDVPLKWPVSDKTSPRLYWIIGWDEPHSSTIYRYLFEPGQGGTLRCIRDLKTGKWRLWNRGDPADVAREKESELTPPLIPHELIVGGILNGIAWHDKKGTQWNSFRLTNGSLVQYWPSSQLVAKPGDAVSGLWIDEDIQQPQHLKEWQDRLTDMRGWFLWSVWPQTKNNALMDLKDRAEATVGDENPMIQQVQLIMSRNPFIDSVARSEALGRMESDEEIARRDRGETLLNELEMYNFVPLIHCLRHADYDRRMEAEMHSVRWKLTQLLMTDGRLPGSWTRYLSIDPSHTRTAIHSWVVPPPQYDGIEIGNLAIVEWELILLRHSADMLAKAVANRIGGLQYEAFVMDQQIGRQTSTAQDETNFILYEQAFRKEKIVSRQTMSGFMLGCNIPATRFAAVRRMLTPQQNGMPMILFVEDKIPQTKKEFGTYRKKQEQTRDGMVILDQPANPRKHDCMASVEYGGTMILSLMDVGVAYTPVADWKRPANPILAEAKKIMDGDKVSQDNDYVHLGAGARA